ncbi:hypothetical protein PCE1_004480 [Barthelona sp. PCE]
MEPEDWFDEEDMYAQMEEAENAAFDDYYDIMNEIVNPDEVAPQKLPNKKVTQRKRTADVENDIIVSQTTGIPQKSPFVDSSRVRSMPTRREQEAFVFKSDSSLSFSERIIIFGTDKELYCRRRTALEQARKKEDLQKSMGQYTRLLDRSMADYREDVQKIKRKLLKNRMKRINRCYSERGNLVTGQQMMTSKFFPQRLSELVTPENINAKFQEWVLCYDRKLFPARFNERKRKAIRNKQKQPDSEPSNKIFMLSGAPGCGKTTLPHFFARLLGYRVIETNASDDRTASKLKQVLSNALTLKTVFGDRRPVMVLLDEVDGLDSIDSVNVILKMSEQARNPIICVCNDPWLPKLRELRRAAIFFDIPPRDDIPHTFLTRLSEIAKNSGLKVTNSLLEELIRHTKCDLRGCIMALDFFRRQPSTSKKIKRKKLMKYLTGGRDLGVSINNGLSVIFKQDKSNIDRAIEAFFDNNRVESQVLVPLLRSLEKVDDPRRMLKLFEFNIARLPLIDPTMTRFASWYPQISSIDRLSQKLIPIAITELYSELSVALESINGFVPTMYMPRIQRPGVAMLRQQFFDSLVIRTTGLRSRWDMYQHFSAVYCMIRRFSMTLTEGIIPLIDQATQLVGVRNLNGLYQKRIGKLCANMTFYNFKLVKHPYLVNNLIINPNHRSAQHITVQPVYLASSLEQYYSFNPLDKKKAIQLELLESVRSKIHYASQRVLAKYQSIIHQQISINNVMSTINFDESDDEFIPPSREQIQKSKPTTPSKVVDAPLVPKITSLKALFKQDMNNRTMVKEKQDDLWPIRFSYSHGVTNTVRKKCYLHDILG